MISSYRQILPKMDISKSKMKSNSFVFLDIKTEGPFQKADEEKPKITEICFVSVPRQTLTKVHLHANSLPRNMQKLIFTVNPGKMISDEITEITGLDNIKLQDIEKFDEKEAVLIKHFLLLQKPPLTLIAHGGYHFNFPLLKEELIKFKDIIPQNTRCGDTFYAFKELSFLPEVTKQFTFNPYLQQIDFDMVEISDAIDLKKETEKSSVNHTVNVTTNADMKQMQLRNETTPKSQKISSVPNPSNIKKRKLIFQNGDNLDTNRSMTNDIRFSLGNSYRQMFGSMPPRSHRVEDNTITMMRCALKFGQPILDWLDKNSVPYDSIPPIYSRQQNI